MGHKTFQNGLTLRELRGNLSDFQIHGCHGVIWPTLVRTRFEQFQDMEFLILPYSGTSFRRLFGMLEPPTSVVLRLGQDTSVSELMVFADVTPGQLESVALGLVEHVCL